MMINHKTRNQGWLVAYGSISPHLLQMMVNSLLDTPQEVVSIVVTPLDSTTGG